MKRVLRYLHRVTMGLNLLANTVLGGDPFMPVSARAGLAREEGSRTGAAMCEFLDWVDWHDGDAPEGDHCAVAVRNYRAR